MGQMEVRSAHTRTTVRLTDDYLEIDRAGGFTQVHRKGVKRMPLRAISAVQLKPPGVLSAGFLQLTVSGGREGVATSEVTFEAAKDENSILFVKQEVPSFEALRDAIQEAISRPTAGTGDGSGQPLSVADELMKLAQLRDAGVLTESEFESQKTRLMN